MNDLTARLAASVAIQSGDLHPATVEAVAAFLEKRSDDLAARAASCARRRDHARAAEYQQWSSEAGVSAAMVRKLVVT